MFPVTSAPSSVANEVEAANGHRIPFLISALLIVRIIDNLQGPRCRVNESPPGEQLWEDFTRRRQIQLARIMCSFRSCVLSGI